MAKAISSVFAFLLFLTAIYLFPFADFFSSSYFLVFYWASSSSSFHFAISFIIIFIPISWASWTVHNSSAISSFDKFILLVLF